MELTWLTDIHLNFLDADERKKFYQEIINTRCDGVLISGDIAEAPSIRDILQELSGFIKKPVYFILGNHDYYRGQVDEVRDEMTALTESNEYLFWLPVSDIHLLDKDIFLIGQDGWADGRLGDYVNSRVALNDSHMIADLFQEKIVGRFQLLKKMQQLADADAEKLQENIELAISKHPKKVVVLTHVPPFKESSMHKGTVSDDNWLPYFSSKVVGDVLMQAAQKNPHVEFLILCGHTHSEAIYQPLNNMLVETGKAEYMFPEIQKIILV
ncbi:MAG: metallophosphoesterase family protein [Gammaproteobacteria bacterium]